MMMIVLVVAVECASTILIARTVDENTKLFEIL